MMMMMMKLWRKAAAIELSLQMFTHKFRIRVGWNISQMSPLHALPTAHANANTLES